jgi:diguanylate cyclase (GGDEF)-like protein
MAASGHAATSMLGTVLLVTAALLAAVGAAGLMPKPMLARRRPLAVAGLLVAILGTAVTGGTPAALAATGLAAWAVAECFGIGVGSLGFAAAAVAAALVYRGAPTATMLGAAALVVCTGALPFWYGLRLSRAHARDQRRVTRLEAHLTRATPAKPMPAAGALRREVLLSVERTEASQDLATLDGVLRDVRDMIQAEEAIFWRWSEERDTLVPHAWSTEDASRPQYFRVQDWGPLARWAAEERIVALDGSDEAPRFAAAPIVGGERLHGVVTVTSNIGLAVGREVAKEWLPRFAAQLAAYMELFDMRTQYGRHMRRNQALIEAMERLQVHKSAEALGNAVCETALEVTSGRAALLIRWLPQDGYGLVQCASRELTLEPGTIIGKDTLVGRTCRDGLPFLLKDARAVTRSDPAYTTSTTYRQIPSLAVVPVLCDQRVIGAIVVEGGEPGSLAEEEARNVGLLAAVARGSLEKVWEIEEVTQRARTDDLTGLANRRHFDEQLRRVLAETDRFGGTSSLILVDIDLFKAVNDTYGHEAGDAVLRQVAKTLGDGVRAVDICARFGGEEIAILLPQTPVVGASELAERLRKAIADRPVVHEGTPIRVTASFGIAGYPETVPHGDWLFPAADKALYSAKSEGRNCVRSLVATNEMPTNYKSAR